VVLGGQGAVARAVYKGTTDCPSITIDGTAQPMKVRMLPESGSKAAFPVLVCELPIPADTKSAVLGGRNLPLPPATLSAVAFIGDTGCRLKAGKETDPKDKDYEEDGKFQDCDKKSKWPFSTLAASVAKRKPQILIHVGDYIYRENPCPKGDKGCKGSPSGDNWDTWKADFFKPAAPLLAAAPWIATRGNHEICSRAGKGFLLFLDPRLAQQQGPPVCNEDVIPQFTVTIGTQQFIVLDSSSAPDECATSACSESDAYAQQFAAMNPAPGAWLVSHRPVWGFKNKGAPLNATLQAALAKWNGQLPPGFTLAAAGHIHIWEVLSFEDAGAAQFVLGNGGTMLTHAIKAPLNGRQVGARTVRYGASVDKWGFTIFTPKSGGWTATYYSTKGNGKLGCTVTSGSVSCH
jgi:hypothetical protein